MTHTWDPDRYLTYADERGRPFVDLVARIAAADPRAVVDLGCGPGNLTALLADRWPGADVTGVDTSPEMIARPARADAGSTFEVADLRDWAARRGEPVDVLVSNATLQWLPDHLELLPAPGRPGRARRLVRVPGARQLRRAQPHDPRRARRRGRRTPSTPRRRRARQPRPGDYLEALAGLGLRRSTPGRRRTSTCSPARTRSSPGSPAPAPGRRCRRCPTGCGRTSRRSSGRGCGGLPRRRGHGVVLPFRRIFAVGPQGPADEAPPRPGRLPAPAGRTTRGASTPTGWA